MGVSPEKRSKLFMLMVISLLGIILAGLAATGTLSLDAAVVATICAGLIMGYIWDQVLLGASWSLFILGCMLLALSAVTRLFH